MPIELLETFHAAPLNPHLRWMNKPSRWETGATGLQVWTDSPTDFWQRTHYGFQVDNGHVLGADVTGDFTMRTDVTFHPMHQYDQAGLMVYFSPDCWLKCSVEYEPDGPSRLGCVVTNQGYSDWSTQDFAAAENRITLEVRRAGADFHVAFISRDGTPSQMRIAHLHTAETSATPHCGLYACSPQGQGFSATFRQLRIEMV